MKTNKVIAFMFLAALATGCTKEKSDRISIFAEQMGGNNSKVYIPDNDNGTPNVNGATWVAGETINLNGDTYTINDNAGGSFSLNVEPLEDDMYAIYPATTAAGDDIVTVARHDDADDTVTIKQLAITFLPSGGHRVVFPMEAQASAGAGALHFDHLTGGLRITLKDTASAAVTLGKVKIVVRSETAVGAISHNGVVATWAVQGPTMPGGEVGGISGDHGVGYSSEMNFALKTGSMAGVTIAARDSLCFCVPMTVSSLRYLTVTGYNPDGSQRFTISKDLGSSTAIQRNYIYNIPTIKIK